MTDLDPRLRRDLATLANQMRASDVADRSVRYGEQLRLRRRSIAATSGIAVAVAAIVVPLTVVQRSTSNHGLHTFAATGGGTSSRTARPFEVGPPFLGGSNGFQTRQPPVCRAGQIRTRAVTRSSPFGVIGVLSIDHPRCEVELTRIPEALLNAEGHRLPVAVIDNLDKANPNSDFTSSFSSSPSRFGFAWEGTWCGARATGVRIATMAGAIDGPLSGPEPSCNGVSKSVVVPGAAGSQGPPTAWRSLSTSLKLDPITRASTLTGLQVTLTNSASQPIPLDPVPQYLIGLEDKFSDGSEASAFGMFAGPQGQPFVVPANGSLTVSLPPQPFFEPEAFPPNGLLRVTFRFAGVPSGLATTTIHCNDVTTRLGAPRCAGRVAGPGDL